MNMCTAYLDEKRVSIVLRGTIKHFIDLGVLRMHGRDEDAS